MTNKLNSVLYTGVTGNLVKRVYDHKNKQIQGFTTKYNVGKLVYFEISTEIESAILKEKQIKGVQGKRKSI